MENFYVTINYFFSECEHNVTFIALAVDYSNANWSVV